MAKWLVVETSGGETIDAIVVADTAQEAAISYLNECEGTVEVYKLSEPDRVVVKREVTVRAEVV